MKKNFIYLGIILCVGLLEVACENKEPFITRIIRDCIFINVPFRGLLIFKMIVLLIPFFYRRVTLSGIPFGSMSE